MKKITTIAAVLLITASVWAQAPEKMSYQAVVRDASNALVTTQAVGMQISILQGSVSGTAVYVETQTPNTNANGLVSLEIGNGTVVSGTFATIDWANGPYFIKTETDLTGGTNYTITGTTQLMSVPYALHAKTADNIAGGINETDPIFGASVANAITVLDTANWNNHTVDTDTHIDSLGIANLGYVAGGITTETDPIFGASVANAITVTDTANWNNHTVDTDTHIDSLGIANLGYVAGGITAETDPTFTAWDKSTGITITESQISDLTHTVDTDTHIDSLGIANLGYVAGGITAETDPTFTAWDKSTGITISESQISDLTHTVDTDTHIDSLGIANLGYVAGVTQVTAGTNVTVTGAGTTASPYVVNATGGGSGHYVGELFGGGIVFYVYDNGAHGLIASLDDLDGGSGVAWSATQSTTVPGGALNMTDGVANTGAIVAQDGTAGYAATLCNSYAGGGFTDWYLPANRELYLLASQDVLIDQILDNDGNPATNGFSQENTAPTYGRYWSSTEYVSSHAWYYSFGYGYSYGTGKLNTYRVRAVRAF